jgi:Flp pilus assembly protein TadB
MKPLFILLFSILSLVFLPSTSAIAHQSVSVAPKTNQKNITAKTFKLWKVQKRRHSNPAPIFLVIALAAAAGAVAVYFLTPLVVLAAVLGGIAFIGFILYFVYSGAN